MNWEELAGLQNNVYAKLDKIENKIEKLNLRLNDIEKWMNERQLNQEEKKSMLPEMGFPDMFGNRDRDRLGKS